MSKYPQSWRACVDRFHEALKEDPTLTKRTVWFYQEQAACAFQLIEKEVRSDALPQNLTKDDVWSLLEFMRTAEYTVATQRNYVSGVRKICQYYNNMTVGTMKIRWPQDMRPNVDWLTLEQAKNLMNIPKSPAQELIIHLELCLGFRRCEVARLRTDHIHIDKGYVEVIGKGPMGGKMRSVPFHPRTREILAKFDAYRNKLISTATAKAGAPVIVPDQYLIYQKGCRLHVYSDIRLTGIDRIVKQVADQVGFSFSNHTLRRTFGRIMYRSHVPVATISKLLGHESTEVTLRYLGIDMDDMNSAMEKFALI